MPLYVPAASLTVIDSHCGKLKPKGLEADVGRLAKRKVQRLSSVMPWVAAASTKSLNRAHMTGSSLASVLIDVAPTDALSKRAPTVTRTLLPPRKTRPDGVLTHPIADVLSESLRFIVRTLRWNFFISCAAMSFVVSLVSNVSQSR